MATRPPVPSGPTLRSFADRVISKPTPHPTPDDLERDLLALIGERLLDLPAGFSATARLGDAGLDSMAVMQLLLLIEDRFGVWLPEQDLVAENLASVRTLAHVLRRRLGESNGGGDRNGAGERNGA